MCGGLGFIAKAFLNEIMIIHYFVLAGQEIC